jgi:hypothetical protein
VVNVAFPPLRVIVPSVGGVEALSWNVIVPVGATVVDDVTVAVKVTGTPRFDELFEEMTEVELAALFTVCVRTGEVLPAKFASPP